jgi:hypothetical protein
VSVTAVDMMPKAVLFVPFEESKVGLRLDRPKVVYAGIGIIMFELFAAETGIKGLILACPGTYDTAKEL